MSSHLLQYGDGLVAVELHQVLLVVVCHVVLEDPEHGAPVVGDVAGRVLRQVLGPHQESLHRFLGQRRRRICTFLLESINKIGIACLRVFGNYAKYHDKTDMQT